MYRMYRKLFAPLTGICLACLVSLKVAGAEVLYFADVTGFIIDDENFGGCMIKPSPVPESQPGLESCAASWLSLDCAGNHSSKSVSAQKLSMAQLAWVTGMSVRVRVDSAKTNNGYCVVERLDIFGAAP